jgi:hypothetical protein
MKNISKNLDKAINCHVKSYAKEVHKWKRISDDEDYLMNENPNTCNDRHVIRMAKKVCTEVICSEKKKSGAEQIVHTGKKNVKRKKKSSHITAGIGKVKYQILKPQHGDMYTPTELVELLLSEVDEEHRRLVTKDLSTKKLILVKFRVVLRHIQHYKEGKKYHE